MLKLSALGFSENTYVETIVVTSGPAGVRAAPVGMLLQGDNLYFKLFKRAATYANLVQTKECTVNVTSSALKFYAALKGKAPKKAFATAKYVKVPRLRGADAVVEARLLEVQHEERLAEVLLRPIHLRVFRKTPKAFDRANAALIEALVHYTRVTPYLEAGSLGDAEKLLSYIGLCRETVYKASSDEDLRGAVDEILNESEKAIRSFKAKLHL